MKRFQTKCLKLEVLIVGVFVAGSFCELLLEEMSCDAEVGTCSVDFLMMMCPPVPFPSAPLRRIALANLKIPTGYFQLACLRPFVVAPSFPHGYPTA